MTIYKLSIFKILNISLAENILVAKLEDILKRIGKQISYYREQKDMNQSDLARELNKDRQFIQKIEKGRSNVTMRTLYEISTVLDITINDLLEK